MISRISYCEINQKGKVVDIDGGIGAVENIRSMGLDIGDEISIKSRKNGRGKISVLKDDNEISLGYELASKILLECSEQPKVTLDKIKVGDTVKVTKMGAQGDIRYRLLDMGLVKGVKLIVVRVAPLGDPIEVTINSFHLSLRLQEAENIEVEIVEINKSNGNRKKRWGIF
ncbi:MAG: FeoA family protein [Bacteroidota bacterium]